MSSKSSRKRTVEKAEKAKARPLIVPNLNPRLVDLYKAPFTYDGISYIWDANKEMVADFRAFPNMTVADGRIRPRGWGRFQYMANGGAIHDAMERLVIETCKDFPTAPAFCVAALNALWEKEGDTSLLDRPS